MRPKTARKRPSLGRINPKTARKRPSLGRINPKTARITPDRGRIAPMTGRIDRLPGPKGPNLAPRAPRPILRAAGAALQRVVP